MTLNASVKRKGVIANNIANADTPHYKKKDVIFESELQRALASEKKQGLRAKTEDSRHIPFNIKQDYREVKPKVHTEWNSNYRNDKNNVDIEKEFTDEVKNTMRYKAITTLVTGKFAKLKSVMK